MPCGVLIIATRKYKQFVPNLLEQIDKLFLPKEELTVFLFTDEEFVYNEHDYDFTVRQRRIPPYKFPEATIYRYKTFDKHSEDLKHCSHLYYLDVDMAVIENVGEEILVDGLMAVRHPGFFISDQWGSEGNPEMSTSFFPKEHRRHYYAGGVQGGKTEHYLEAVKVIAERIDEDERNGTMAIYHDETHWNRYTNYDRPELVTEFTPAYCMVEQEHLRKAWGIDHLQPKILALSKNHSEIRS